MPASEAPIAPPPVTAHCPQCTRPAAFSNRRARHYCDECQLEFDAATATLPPPVPPPTPRGRVFLSYGHDPACVEIVQRIQVDLQAAGWEPWVDDKGIRFGDDWRREITRGIQDSQHVLAFLSQHSTRKPGVCRQEVAIALGPRKGHVYTVLVEPLERVSPPLIVSHLQWLDMQQWQELKAKDPVAYEALYRKSLQEILRVLERNEPFAGDIELLQRWLDPLDGTADMLAAEEGFTGRRWLLDGLVEQEDDAGAIGEIERWRTSGSANRVFWLSAGPGWGKSAVAARLAHAARARVMAVHYCRYNKPNTRDARQVVRTLAFQMATQLGDYRELLVRQAKLGTALAELNAMELFDKLLANPLAHELGGGRNANDRHLIVLDALDETLENDRSELLTLVAGEFGKLPPWLGLVVTSRPEAPVKAQLGAFGVQHQEEKDPRNLEDLRTYVQAWLQGVALEPAQREQALGAVVQASEGMFLYVRQLREAVAAGTVPPAQLTDPASLPKGLAGLYQRWFQARFGSEESQKAYDRWQRPLLELMLAAREPLPLTLAHAVLGWGAYGEGKALEPLGTLCTQQGGTVSLFHKSLADWLARREESGRHFHASPAQGHQCMAAGLWEAYTRWREAGAHLQGRTGWQPLGEAGESYAMRHLPAHLAAAGLDDERRQALTDFALAMRRCAASEHEALLDGHLGGDAGPGDAELQEWRLTLRAEGHLFTRSQAWWPTHRLLLQMAMERAAASPLRRTAERWRTSHHENWPWLWRELADTDPQAGSRRFIDLGQGRAVGVLAMDVSWPEQRVAVACANGDVLVFDLQTGRRLRLESLSPCARLRLEGDELHGFHRDGSSSQVSLASLSRSETPAAAGLGVQEAAAQSRVRTSRNGLFTINWDGQGTVAVEAADESGPVVQHALSAKPDVKALAVADDGSRWAVGCGDGSMWHGTMDSALAPRRLAAGKKAIYGIDITPGGQWLATVGMDGALRVWNALNGDLRVAEVGHAYGATRVCLAPDAHQAVTAGQDGKLILWNLASMSIGLPRAEVTSIAMLPPSAEDTDSWATSDAQGRVQLHTRRGAVLQVSKSWQAHGSKIWDMAVTPDGQYVATAAADGHARVWHCETGACVAHFASPSGKPFRAISISPAGRWLVVAGQDKRPQVHDLHAALHAKAGDGVSKTLEAALPPTCRSPIEKLLFLNETHFLSADTSGMIRCWKIGNPTAVWERDHGDDCARSPGQPQHGPTGRGAYALALSRSGRYLACSGRGVHRGISLWNLDGPSPTLVHVLHGHERGVHFLAFRDDDRHLVSASWDETVVMWDWRQGERLLLRPIPQLSAALDLADGDRLAVGTGLGDVFTLQFQNIPAADTRE
jgi:WD40 repeat protein